MCARRVDILGIGQNATDTLVELSHFPAPDTKVEWRRVRILPGGQVATAVIACRKWGLRARYIGRVGDDAAGELQRRELRRHKVESRIIVVRNCASQASIILVDVRSGERTILFRRDDRVALRESDVPREWVRECRLVHVDGHNAGASTYAARLARRAGVLTMADLDHVYPGIPALLREVDYPVTSQAFLMQFTGERDLPRAMQQFRAQYQSRAVCSTLGIGGAVLWDGARFWYSPSYRVQVVDTTGAGDVFHAGFGYGVLQGWELQRVLDFSCAAAGLNCKALGAREGIPSLRAIRRLQRVGQRNPAAFLEDELCCAARRWAAEARPG